MVPNMTLRSRLASYETYHPDTFFVAVIRTSLSFRHYTRLLLLNCALVLVSNGYLSRKPPTADLLEVRLFCHLMPRINTSREDCKS